MNTFESVLGLVNLSQTYSYDSENLNEESIKYAFNEKVNDFLLDFYLMVLRYSNKMIDECQMNNECDKLIKKLEWFTIGEKKYVLNEVHKVLIGNDKDKKLKKGYENYE